jgi:hypothetical protein
MIITKILRLCRVHLDIMLITFYVVHMEIPQKDVTILQISVL